MANAHNVTLASAKRVSKQWFKWADTYGIDIRSTEDQVLLLAVTVVIDEACHPDDGKRH